MSRSDNFDRADNVDLGASWTPIVGSCKIVSKAGAVNAGVRGAGGTGYHWEAWTADSWESHQSSQVTLRAGFVDCGPIVHGKDDGGADGYMAMAHHTLGMRIYRRDNGGFTLLSDIGGTLSAGDTVKLEYNAGTLTYYKNGVSQGTASDSTYGANGGSAGIYATDQSNDTAATPEIDDWIGQGEVPSGSGLSVAQAYAVAAWPLDEISGTRFDSVGSSDLTDNNTVGSTAGKFGNAADFESGNSEYLSIADNTDISAGDVKFCIRVWVRLESKADSQGVLGKWQTSGGKNREYLLFYDSGLDRWRFAIADPADSVTVVTADNFGAVSTGAWMLLHAWHDDSANLIGISVNAGAANTESHSTGIRDDVSDFIIGANGSVGGVTGQFFDGLIDDTVILKWYILDATERTEDYNGGTGVAFADWADTGEVSGAVSEVAKVSDALTSLTELLASTSEGAKAGDSFAATSDLLALVSEGAVTAESLTAALETLVALTEGVRTGESYLSRAELLASVLEGLKAGDEFTRRVVKAASLTEGALLGDVFAGEISTGVFGAISEQALAGDSSSVVANLLTAWTEQALAGDSRATRLAAVASLLEQELSADSWTARITRRLSWSEGAKLGEAFNHAQDTPGDLTVGDRARYALTIGDRARYTLSVGDS